MKKRLLALLVVLVMLVGLLPTMALAEESACTHVDEGKDCICDSCGETVHHSDYVGFTMTLFQHGSWCSSCSVYYDMADHEDNDGDNVCDVCQMCAHSGAQWMNWPGDQHMQNCDACQRVLAGPEAHSFEDGVCTGCNKAYCAHTNTELRAYDTNHVTLCTDCDAPISDSEEHTDADDNNQCDGCLKELCTDGHQVADCYCTVCGLARHSTGDGWNYGASGHWKVCEVCYATVAAETHADADGDKHCDICGHYVCGGNHEPYWDNPHWCRNCDAFLSECEDEDGDGVCDLCGSCADGHNTEETDKWDIRIYVDHCEAYCQVCGDFVYWGHDYLEGDVCIVCRYTPCEGEHMFSDGICSACGGECGHSYESAVCNICGFECPHKNTQKYFYWGDHYVCCTDCWQDVVPGGPHNMVDGTCTECGFTPCVGEHTPSEDDPHVCAHCLLLTDCVDEDENCVCDICGNENFHRDTRWEKTETSHRVVCNNCEQVLEEAAHFDEDGVLGCDYCGYGCLHEQIAWYIDEYYHEGWCTSCGEIIAEFDLHTGEGDTCDICGAKPCQDGHTPSTEGDPHFCVKCEITISCGADGNGDCLCDMCGESCHFYLISFNEIQHRERCYMCGRSTQWEDHRDEDENGLCDICFFGCEHERQGWYISHFNHFNWCQDCGVLIDNIADHVDADSDAICDLCTMENPHIWKAVAEVPATCKADGMKAHYTCDSCELLWSEKIAFTCNSLCLSTTVEAEELIIPKTAHAPELKNVKAATCTAKGYSGDEICKHCGETVKAGAETDMLPHDYKDGICTVCKAKDPISVKVETSAGTPDVEASIPAQELLTQEDKAAAAQGTPVEIQLTVENADQTVAPEDKTGIEKAVAEINAGSKPAQEGDPAPETKIGMYLEINLTKTVGQTQSAITETGTDVTICVEVPAGLQNTQEDTDREFSMLRLHNGRVDMLKDLDTDPNTVTVNTDCFSTYVLVYTDTPVRNAEETDPAEPTIPETDVPQTGDESNIQVYFCLMIVSTLCLILLALNLKKRAC